MLQNCALEGSDHDVGGQVVSFFLVAKVGFQLVSVLLGEAREWNWVGGKGEMRMWWEEICVLQLSLSAHHTSEAT